MTKRSVITQELQNSYPEWSKVRTDENSVGAQLLNGLAIPMETFAKNLVTSKANTYLMSTNLDEIDLTYKVSLPANFSFTVSNQDPANPQYVMPTVTGTIGAATYPITLATDNDVQSFWYTSIPNRASLEQTISGVSHQLIDFIASGYTTTGMWQHHLGGGAIWIESVGGTRYLRNEDNSLVRGHINVHGLNRQGQLDQETIIFPWDMNIESSKEWSEIHKLELKDMEPEVEVIVSSANFNAADRLSPFNLRYSENRNKIDEFWGLGAINNGSLWISTGGRPAGFGQSRLAISGNGIDWQQVTSPWADLYDPGEGDEIMRVADDGAGLMIIVGGCSSWSARLATSRDGINWTERDSKFPIETGNILAIAHGKGMWVIGGQFGLLSTSPDGETWTLGESNRSDKEIWDIATDGNGTWVAIGNTNLVTVSTDNGLTWDGSNIGTTSGYYGVAYNDGLWVIGGASGTLYISTDATNWSSHNSQFGESLIDTVCYHNGLWIIGGTAGKLATSTNGLNWTLHSSGFTTSGIINQIACSNDRCLAFGTSSINGVAFMSSSLDGLNWSSVTPPWTVDQGFGIHYVPFTEAAIFEDNGGSTLDRIGYITDEWQQLVQGFVTKEPKRRWEMLTSGLTTISGVDIALQPFTDRAWVATEDGMLYLYDTTEEMPANISLLKDRTPGSEVQLDVPNTHILLGEDIAFTPWHARPIREIQKWRVWFQTPTGNRYGIFGGADVPITSEFWNYTPTLKRSIADLITLTSSERGEYLITLEVVFVDGVTHIDKQLVTVEYKTPLVTIDISTLVGTNVTGIDFDADQKMWVLANGNYYQINLHSDIMLVDTARKVIYFKEPYESVSIT